MIWLTILLLALSVIACRIFYVRGVHKGYAQGATFIEERWEKLRRTPIAGQAVDVPSFGEVIVLGRGEIDGVPHIDYIQSKVLNGRNIPDLTEEELAKNTISCPLDEFVAQCELSIKLL